MGSACLPVSQYINLHMETALVWKWLKLMEGMAHGEEGEANLLCAFRIGSLLFPQVILRQFALQGKIVGWYRRATSNPVPSVLLAHT